MKNPNQKRSCPRPIGFRKSNDRVFVRLGATFVDARAFDGDGIGDDDDDERRPCDRCARLRRRW